MKLFSFLFTLPKILIAKLIFGFCFSLLVTLYTIPYLIKLAQYRGLIDIPDNKLKNHAEPVSYLGGVGIYLGFLSAFLFVLPFDNRTYLVVLGTTLLLFLGLLDDLMPLRAGQKFMGQAIVALYFLRMGFHLKEQFFHQLPNIAISFLWLVTVVNAFNLIDVVDGLAAMCAFITALGFLICALVLHATNTALLLCCFIGAIIGFSWYNKPKAVIYMGDAGSLWLGGMLAATPFLLPWSTINFWGMLAVPVFLAIPLLEIVLLLARRTYKGIPFYLGSPDHHALLLKHKNWCLHKILAWNFMVSCLFMSISILFVLNVLSVSQFLASTSLISIYWYSSILF